MASKKPKNIKIEVNSAWLEMILRECKFADDHLSKFLRQHTELAKATNLDSAGVALENAMTYIADKLEAARQS